jgi:hypothetical protein
MENNQEIVKNEIQNDKGKFIIFLPLTIICLLIVSFAFQANEQSIDNINPKIAGFTEYFSHTANVQNLANKINILSESDVSVGLKDTVYTDKDCWLELRIDQQMLYQHWRNGKVEKYGISSGNKYLSRSIESRPGLFAIFVKVERHESSQYNNAEMYHFMPFNQGIGFHSLNGTGYYGNLGVRPSSHGCIRMRHDEVKKVFKDCPLGTLVLAHRGYTARTVGFAPEGYENKDSLSKEEEKYLLASNLYNVLEGNYFVSERKFFVVNPKTIPVSGVYMGYDAKLPEKQKTKKSVYFFANENDIIGLVKAGDILDSLKSSEFLADMNYEIEDIKGKTPERDLSSAELIKKYFSNPIGVLPYFPPENK